jgi:hypothetical protein
MVVRQRGRIDTGFVFMFAAGFLIGLAGLAGIFTGTHITKSGIATIGADLVGRKDSPISFWLRLNLVRMPMAGVISL